MEDKPTEITQEDVDQVVKDILTREVFIPLCGWCKLSSFVREVGPNYICYDCEVKERQAGRPLVFTAPVSDAYFKLESQ